MIVNPAGLYGGGAFKVDTTTATNFFLKQKAAEQAKADVLDKYFRDLPSKATDKGMRDQDRPAFDQALLNYQNFYIQNRDKLASGRYPNLQLEAQQKGQLPFTIANSSIGALNDAKQVGTVIASSPEGKDAFDEKTLGTNPDGTPYIDPVTTKGTGLRAHDLPIYIVDANKNIVENPDHVNFDVTQVIRNPKRLSEEELQKTINEGLKTIPRSKNTEFVDIKGDPLLVNKVTTEQYDPNDLTTLKSVGDKIGSIYEDPNVKFTFKKKYPFSDYNEQTVAGFDAANKAFNAVYGRPIQPANNKEFFIGLNLAGLKPDVTTEQVVSEKKKMVADEARSQRQARYQANLNKGKEYVGAHPFDAVSMAIPNTKLSIKDGVVYDEKGQPYSSASGQYDITVPIASLDSRVRQAYKEAGIKGYDIDGSNVNLQVKNGVIQGVYNKDIGTISRDKFNKKGTQFVQPKVTTGGTSKPSKKGSLNGL